MHPFLPNISNRRLPGGTWREKLTQLAPALDHRHASIAAAVFLTANGDQAAAECVYREILERRPMDVGALQGLAQILRITGKNDDAARMRLRALEAEAARMGLEGSERHETAMYLFAAEGGGPTPASAPRSYIAKSFDGYETFDDVLLNKLNYQGPQLLRSFVQKVLDPRPRELDILDVGCGTGLSGAAFVDLARTLDGVDLSPAMIERARTKQLYRQLEVNDIITAMLGKSSGYDLVIALDVFLYFGDLTSCFAAAAKALRPGGALCCSVELADGQGFILHGTRRFAHSREHLESCARTQGMTMHHRECTLRMENAHAVKGLLAIARMP